MIYEIDFEGINEDEILMEFYIPYLLTRSNFHIPSFRSLFIHLTNCKVD